MTIQPTLVRNYFAPQGQEPDLLLLHDGQVHVPVPALGNVFGKFVDDSQGGAIAAAVASGGMSGYIDTRGAWIVAPRLDDARPFSADGLALFCDQGTWGYMNRRGKVAIDPQYAQGGPFQHGKAAPPDTTAWCVQPDAASPESNRLWLGLFTQAGYGDGDVWHNIWLVCAPSQEALAAALDGRIPAYPADDDDHDDDD